MNLTLKLFAKRKIEWLSGRMASQLATSASYGVIGCLGGGHDKEMSNTHVRTLPSEAMSLTEKGGGKSLGMDAVESEYAGE